MVTWRVLDRREWVALVLALVLLVFAYLVYPDDVFQYAVWLVVFTVWMVWFVYHLTRRLYGLEQ